MTNRQRNASTPVLSSARQALLKNNTSDDDDPSIFYKEIKSRPGSRSNSPRGSVITNGKEHLEPVSQQQKSDWHRDRYEKQIERWREESNATMLSMERRIAVLEERIKLIEEEEEGQCNLCTIS